MKEITLEARIENLPEVTAFVDRSLEELSCPVKAQMQLDVAVDELFSNIAYYAYGSETGMASVGIEIQKAPRAVILTFTDFGVPYNPLQNKDPDITLSAEERQLGGLGIYMVKKSMDEMEYQYDNGKNILKITKFI